jgi:hypothetical protein
MALPQSLRKASGFPSSFNYLRLCLGGVAAKLSKGAHGKAKPFRKESGKAATKNKVC